MKGVFQYTVVISSFTGISVYYEIFSHNARHISSNVHILYINVKSQLRNDKNISRIFTILCIILLAMRFRR